MRVYLGTRSGVFALDPQTGEARRLGLEHHRFWAIHTLPGDDGQGVILAGSYGAGMIRSTDGGQTWCEANQGLSATAFRTIQRDPINPQAILCGCEPARAFRSLDGGGTWRELEAIPALAGSADWFLPYSPRAGAIRNFSAPEPGGRDLFASVEVGGLLHSPDAGTTWELIEVDPGPRIHDDVHFVINDPLDGDRLFVALGGALVDRTHGQWLDGPRRIGGVARSDDRGRSWRKLLPDYTRAVHIPASQPDLLLAAPAERTDHGGWIIASADRGETWQRADAGIETPMPDMVERFEEAPDGSIWALCSGGRLFRAVPGVWQWTNPLATDRQGFAVDSICFLAT